MQTAGGGFAAALDSDQVVDYKVTITFPSGVQTSYSDVTKSVVSVDVQRSVSSNLPDGTSLIAGYGTAAAQVTLSGFLNQNPGVALVEAQSIYWLMNVNDPTSPMYRSTRAGLPIVIQAGLWDGASSADLVTIFTGTIDSVQCTEGTVSLQCRDQWSTLTNQAALPPVITFPPQNAGLTSEWAIDYLARHASPKSYLSWPAQRANCVLAASLRRSLWPEVGSYASYSQTPIFGSGTFGSGYAGTLGAIYTLAAPIATTQTYFMECWLTNAGSEINVNDTAVTNQFIIQWQSGVGHLVWYTVTPSGQSSAVYTALGTTGSHYISAKVTWAAGSTACNYVITIDGGIVTGALTSLDARNTNPFTVVGAFGGTGASTIEALQVTTETAPPSNANFSPTLMLDPAGSLNPLVAMPDVTGQSVASALQTIAQAEAGAIYFDELGALNFVNRQTVGVDSPVRTITSTSSLKTIDSLEQMSLCATHVTAAVNAVSIGALGFVWSATSALTIQPGVPTVLIVNTGNPVVNVPATDSGFYFGGVGGAAYVAGQSYWQASFRADGTGAWGSNISFTVNQISTTQLLVTITNTASFPLFLMTPAGYPGPNAQAVGTPALFIGGQPINAIASLTPTASNTTGAIIADAQWPPALSGGAVSNPTFGEILLQVPSTTWLQSQAAGQTLVNDLLSDLHYPIPLLRNVDIVADPRLQLLDVVTITDTDVSQINDQALIIGIETTISNGEFSQSIDARPLWPPGAWELGVAGHSEVGTTTYLY